jgi:hypothetical protein
MKDIRKVLLIHPEGNIYNNPTLKCVVDLLLFHKIEVTVRYSKKQTIYHYNLELPFPQIEGIRPLGYGDTYYKIKKFIFFHINSAPLAWLSVYFEHLFVYGSYDLIIAVDRQGLVEAGYLYKITGTPFVFFSFEIYFESETSTSFKSLERRFAKYVKHWFVQDEIRASHLQYENHLDSNTCTLIPLASSGPGKLSMTRLRDRLNVPNEKNVAILMGSIAHWSMVAEIVNSIIKWPDDWVLILHSRGGDTSAKLRKLGIDLSLIPVDKIYLSNQSTLEVDKMGEILSGVSVGLAFYKPVPNTSWYSTSDRNIQYLGLSSGKISTFLRYGIPVITNEIGLYARLAEKHGFGLVSQNPMDIAELLPFLTNSIFSFNATCFYNKYLDFSNYESLVFENLTKSIL